MCDVSQGSLSSVTAWNVFVESHILFEMLKML